MSRKKEREELFKLIFRLLSNPNCNPGTPKTEYVEKGINNIKQNLDSIIEIIKRNTSRWDFREIGAIEKSLLILAVYEIKYDELNHRIAINEAIELAKIYGTYLSKVPS